MAGWYHSGFRNTAGCGDPSASRQCLLRGDVAAPRKVRRPLKRRALGTMIYQVFPAQEVVSRLDVMRVKDLEEICTALNMRKSGKKSELVGRLKTMCASSVLVHAAGGKAAVERVINSAYYRFTEEKGHAYVHRPSPGAKRKLSESAYGDASGWNKPQAGVPVNTPASVDHGVWARALAADPFWAAADEPKLASTPGVVMAPTRLRVSPGTRNHLMLHRPFQITDAQARLLRSDRNKYELQIACVLMDDPVPARLHWPFLANLRVNGRPLPVMYRQSTSPMGKAGRDPPVAVPPESFSTGNNTLTIQAQDVRPFSVLVRVAKRRTLDEVKAAVPAPLSFPMARAHLERELGGGGGRGSDDSDDDLIVQDNAVLSLRCPISGLICRTPARTKLCTGLAVFDLDNYLELNAKVRKWTCPHCGASGRPSDVIIDGFLTRVLGVLRTRESTRSGEDATTTSRVEVEPSGRWRPCLEDNSSKTNDAAWVSAEAMNGVVLGVGGSVLHVPPELLSVSMSGNEIGAGATDLGEESEDEAEELRRAVEEARANRSAAAEAPATAEEHDVIVISDSEEENEDEDVALASTPAALEPALAPESAQDVETEARERAVEAAAGEAAAAAEAASSAAFAAVAAVRAAAEASAASLRASQDSLRLNSPQAYSEMAAAYYDGRGSISAAEASRSRISAGATAATGYDRPANVATATPSSNGTTTSAAAAAQLDTASRLLRGEDVSETRVSARVASTVPGPGEVARAGNHTRMATGTGTETGTGTGTGTDEGGPPAGSRPALKFVFRRRSLNEGGISPPPATAPAAAAATTMAPAERGGEDHLDRLMEEWFDPATERALAASGGEEGGSVVVLDDSP